MKTIPLIMLITNLLLFSSETKAFSTPDGTVVVSVIKRCLFHGEIYESHLSIETPCTFNLNNPPQSAHVQGSITDIAHDPECFGERNEQVY